MATTSAVTFAERRTAEIKRIEAYPLPSRDAGSGAFVIGCHHCAFFETKPNPRKCTHMLSGVGQAGNLIPVGSVVYVDLRSGESLVRDGYARRATEKEKGSAVPVSSFKAKISLERFMDPTDTIKVDADIPQLGVKKGESVSVAKLVAMLTAQAMADEAKRPRSRKKIVEIGSRESVKAALARANQERRVKGYARTSPETRGTR